MSRQADQMLEDECREYWWQFGEAVMREMCEEESEEDRIGSIELLRKKHNMDNGRRVKVKIIKEGDE